MSAGPMSFFITILALIIDKTKPIGLQIPYLNTFSRISKKKLLFNQKYQNFALATIVLG